ncbi:MAG: ABC transporter permease [Smithellaceae bacterium]|nr:ABC transporter permease [Smithellaceae bacterium]
MSWLRIRELVRKEFIALFRDRKIRPILIIAPVVQLMVFGYVVNYDISNVRLAVLDQARTKESRMIIDAFRGNGTFEIVGYPHDQKELEGMLLAGKVDLGVKLAPDLSRKIRGGDTSPVQILADGSMSNMAAVRIVYSLLVVDQVNRGLLRELHPQHLGYGRIDARIRSWYNPNNYSRYFFVPGIVAFLIMLISLLLTSIAIIKEKEAGTIEQLIVTPLRPIEMIIGKTIPYIVISFAQMLTVTVIALLWFQIPLVGSITLLFFATCLFLLSTLGAGLFISTISSTQQQAMMTTFFVIVPFFMLSGFVFPIVNMPTLVQWLTYLNPLRYFLVVIRGIFLKGIGIDILWPQFLALAILGFAVFAGAVGRFRKRLD